MTVHSEDAGAWLKKITLGIPLTYLGEGGTHFQELMLFLEDEPSRGNPALQRTFGRTKRWQLLRLVRPKATELGFGLAFGLVA